MSKASIFGEQLKDLTLARVLLGALLERVMYALDQEKQYSLF